MILFVDTETTDLVRAKLPASHPLQPHIVQLACLLTDEDGTPISEHDWIIKPVGYAISNEVAKIHGITNERAKTEGRDRDEVLGEFAAIQSRANNFVAHNALFDQLVLEAFIHRCGSLLRFRPFECTMKMCSPILQIPPTPKMRQWGFMDYKPPNLGECYKFFFGKEFVGAHNALNDVRACRDVYFAAKTWKSNNV